MLWLALFCLSSPPARVDRALRASYGMSMVMEDAGGVANPMSTREKSTFTTVHTIRRQQHTRRPSFSLADEDKWHTAWAGSRPVWWVSCPGASAYIVGTAAMPGTRVRSHCVSPCKGKNHVAAASREQKYSD